ncbi:MAG: DUF1285 domain-containing protein [Desulfobacteraceae bacterium]|nr:DUF1285 domain-containing protein [Desulfobacteraceae bacterium]
MTDSIAENPSPCEILIDEEGEWFHRGNRLTRKEILEELYSKLEIAPSGDYLLRDGHASCLLEVADTPFVVSRVDKSREESGEEIIVLTLKHRRERQILNPATLFVGEANVLYCQLSDSELRARFTRPAYYQLAELVQEGPPGDFFLELNGRKYPIAGP